MTRTSHQSASSMPPATAGPSTAAITGLDNSSREGPSGPRGAAPEPGGKASPSTISAWNLARSARVAAYFRSHPAQNAPPAPQNTATLAAESASKARKACVSASAVSGSPALRAFGRSLITVVTGPFFST